MNAFFTVRLKLNLFINGIINTKKNLAQKNFFWARDPIKEEITAECCAGKAEFIPLVLSQCLWYFFMVLFLFLGFFLLDWDRNNKYIHGDTSMSDMCSQSLRKHHLCRDPSSQVNTSTAVCWCQSFVLNWLMTVSKTHSLAGATCFSRYACAQETNERAGLWVVHCV